MLCGFEFTIPLINFQDQDYRPR